VAGRVCDVETSSLPRDEDFDPLNRRPALEVWGPVYRMSTSNPFRTCWSRSSNAVWSGKGQKPGGCLKLPMVHNGPDGSPARHLGSSPGVSHFMKLPLPDLPASA